jgi:hypothetical protein
MKNDLDSMMMLAGIIGAWLRGLVENLTKKETLINAISGIFLAMLFIGTVELLKLKIENTYFCIAISFFIGWINLNFTRKLRCVIEDVYDILKQWTKNLLKIK